MLRVYYDVVGDNPDFLSALRELYARVKDSLRPQLGSLFDTEPNTDRDRAAIEALEAFSRRWGLPREGSRSHLLNVLYGPRNDTEIRWGRALSVVVGHSLVLREKIWPLVPVPFVYDTTRTSPESIREYAEQVAVDVKASIVAQAEDMESRVRGPDYRRVSPRHHNRDEVRRMATRLHLRVAQRLSYEQIAQAEGSSVRSVRGSVVRWAVALDVEIPDLRFSPSRSKST